LDKQQSCNRFTFNGGVLVVSWRQIV
jgi:hypothetical protein